MTFLFTDIEGSTRRWEADADGMLAALRRAVPATKGNTRRLASLGPLLQDLEARVIDEHGNVMLPRGVGVIELRGESLCLARHLGQLPRATVSVRRHAGNRCHFAVARGDSPRATGGRYSPMRVRRHHNRSRCSSRHVVNRYSYSRART